MNLILFLVKLVKFFKVLISLFLVIWLRIFVLLIINVWFFVIKLGIWYILVVNLEDIGMMVIKISNSINIIKVWRFLRLNILFNSFIIRMVCSFFWNIYFFYRVIVF